MRVCLLNDSFPPVLDGVANAVTNYAEQLQKRGVSVLVCTPRYPGTDYSAYPYPVLTYQSFDTTALANGYRTGNPFSSKGLSELTAFAPDIIHCHCPASAATLSRMLREQTGAPVVFTYHTKYDVDLRRMLKSKLLAREAIHAMVSTIESFDEVWTVSRGAGENLSQLGYTGDWRVMYNGVDFSKGRADDAAVAAATAGYDLPEGVPVYLFVGRLMTYKGLPLILDALALLAQRGKDFRMVFVGKGPDRELLERQAAELGLADRCIFTGPIYDREVLRAWNTRADLFLFPSTFDTYGLVVREAAACGLGSVLIRGSCAAEDVIDGRNGFTIDETPEALAALLEKVGGDLPLLRELGQRAMDELYLSWSDAVDTALARYGEILEAKRAGLLPAKPRQRSDMLLSLAAKSLEEQERRRQDMEDLREQFLKTTQGMMENILETEGNVDAVKARLRDHLHRELEDFRRR